ncbi:MAG: hypothetical protein IJ246_11365 [Clostridia bacterium]|nr:hypothetical protein [Clostridia bacterium]
MEEAVLTLHAQYNKRNMSECRVYSDRVEMETKCTGGLLPVYKNATRVIYFSEIVRVVISSSTTGFFAHHPNAIHFITGEGQRTLDTLFRDPKFLSRDYIDEGVQQFCAANAQDLTEKIALASRIKAYIEEKTGRKL